MEQEARGKLKSQAASQMRCRQVGGRAGRGRVRGRIPPQCHSSPRMRVSTHSRTNTLTHTRPGARSGGHVRLAPRCRANTPHPGCGSSPAGDAPHSPPPESHWMSKWRGTRGARGEGDPPRFAPQKPRHRGRARSGWRSPAGVGALGTWRPAGGSGRLRTFLRDDGRQREAVGATAGKPRWSGELAAGAPLLTGAAGGQAWRLPWRTRWSCSRRHAWLPGRRCRRLRKSRSGHAASLLSPLPPWAHPPFFSHFIFSLQHPLAPGSPA